jgi:hypothetical protein
MAARSQEYKAVRFKTSARVHGGTAKDDISAIGGVSLTRITDGVRDDLVIEKPGLPTVDVPWSNVASAERMPPPPPPTKKSETDE